jgi:ferredoxin-type protein NapG
MTKRKGDRSENRNGGKDRSDRSGETEELDRRGFLRLGLRKGARAASEALEDRARRKRRNFIRPPFAIGELEFLLACTRCHDCISACPHETIFALSARNGLELAGTPALDLVNRACHMCESWPCVSACKPQALTLAPPLPPPASALEHDETNETARKDDGKNREESKGESKGENEGENEKSMSDAALRAAPPAVSANISASAASAPAAASAPPSACAPASAISSAISGPRPLPRLAMAYILKEHCLPYQGPECGACAHACPVEGALQWNMTKPLVNPDLCTGCALCRQACIASPKAILIRPAPI